jgi:hypothetical protein
MDLPFGPVFLKGSVPKYPRNPSVTEERMMRSGDGLFLPRVSGRRFDLT